MTSPDKIAQIDHRLANDPDLMFSWNKLLTTLHNYKYGKQELIHNYEVLGYAFSLTTALTDKLTEEQCKRIFLSCILHDIGRYAYEETVKKHTELNEDHLAGFLSRKTLDSQDAEVILKCIRRHSISSREQPTSVEEEIVFDSDNLSIFTHFGYIRWFFMAKAWGGNSDVVQCIRAIENLAELASRNDLFYCQASSQLYQNSFYNNNIAHIHKEQWFTSP